MWRAKILATVIMIAILSSGLNAASANKVELYFSGALAFPLEPDEFSDHWKTSVLNLGGGIGHKIIPAISANVYFDWCNFGFDGPQFARDMGVGGEVSISGLDASVMTIMGNVKAVVPSGILRPYFWGGLGLFILSIDDGTVSIDDFVIPLEGDSENALGINFGAGIEVTVAKTVDLFFDGRFVLGFTDVESTSILPLRVGVKVKL
jgi:hypothetical protein